MTDELAARAKPAIRTVRTIAQRPALAWAAVATLAIVVGAGAMSVFAAGYAVGRARERRRPWLRVLDA